MNDETYQTLYKRLNSAQKQAVDTIEGPVMVIAGPGTGKTSILTLRIAAILKRTDTPANGILAITYTDAGVKAMREKLQGIIGDRAHEVRIVTFHSFASAIISEYPDHFLHLTKMKQMTSVDQELLIRSIISHAKFSALRPPGKPDVYLSGIIRSIDDAKRDALTPEMVKAHAGAEIDRIKSDEESISTRGATKGKLKADALEQIQKCERTFLFADVYEEYEKQKRKDLQMDFNDLIIELLVAIRTDELLLRLLQEKYLYIHVDEHQDTNDAQNFIIGLIAEFFETPNIFIVGDEKQAIYRFQGASVENFLLLQKKWPTMKVISLDTNYRSHQGILDASFAMIEKNYEDGQHADLRIRLAAGGQEDAEPLDIVTGDNVAAIESYLVKNVKALIKEQPKSTIAMIVRRNRDLDRVIRLFETNGIPVSSQRSVDIFSHPIGRIFFDFIEYLADPTKHDGLGKTIFAGMWGLKHEDAIVLVRELSSGIYSNIDAKLPQLAKIRDRMLSDGPLTFLITAAEESGFIDLVLREPSYIYVWRGIISLAESVVRENESPDPLRMLQALLAYKASAESRTVKVSIGAPDVQVRALSAHGSKGLEFDYVFIPYANEESWIGKPRGASFVLPKKQTTTSDVHDLRRLFYVALTRARKHVTILSAREESDGKILEPLRFIAELDEKHVSHINLPRIGADSIHTDAFLEKQKNVEGKEVPKKFTELEQRMLDVARHVLTEKGLSVTALNHFMECPNKFLYVSILRLPQIPTISSERGTAIHEAISRVWNSEDKNTAFKVLEIEKTMLSVVTDYFATSVLSLFEKQLALKDLNEDIPFIAKALEPHFLAAKNLSVFTESWVRIEYKGQFTQGRDVKLVTIPLHGKLDTVIDNGNELAIYDYKSKQAMSVAVIKGETKNSDGNYFRQLIYYRILVDGDARWKGRKVIPSLVFVSPDDKGRCPTITLPIEQTDIVRLKQEIQKLIDCVWSGEIVLGKCTEKKCEWCGIRDIESKV